MTKDYKKQRRKGGDNRPFVMLWHDTMDTPAWQALSLAARCLYIELRRISGSDTYRNGRLFLSVRDAAAKLGVAPNTAARAFDELQAKGFTRPNEIGCLGINGKGKATTWTLTEIGTDANRTPEKLYRAWREGEDFPVAKGRKPVRTKQMPVSKSATSCIKR